MGRTAIFVLIVAVLPSLTGCMIFRPSEPGNWRYHSSSSCETARCHGCAACSGREPTIESPARFSITPPQSDSILQRDSQVQQCDWEQDESAATTVVRRIERPAEVLPPEPPPQEVGPAAAASVAPAKPYSWGFFGATNR